jgi:farnesyl diphosphate synthase
MRYAVLGGGKRIRPLLVFAASELSSGDRVDVSLVNRAACAIEMIHTYSLVHDDLPCMDDDDLRRGRPTVHKAFDEATALLVGDALQTRAFEILSHPINVDPQISLAQLRMIESLAHASGSKGMAGGQAIDLQNVGKKMDLPALEEMHAMKTGALLICAVELGGIAAQLPPASMSLLDTYAKALGLAFQVVDDILDATADSATLGKTAGKDAAQDKPTYVTLKGLDYANKLAKELKGRALDSLNEFGPQADALRHLAHLVVDRKK